MSAHRVLNDILEATRLAGTLEIHADGAFKTNTIAETTSGSGVTIDGVLCKDSAVTADLAGSAALIDNETLDFGTGHDVVLKWNASYLEAGPETGFWADCPSPLDPDPSRAIQFFDDFIATSIGDVTSTWTLDSTNGTAIIGEAETSNTPGIGGYVTLNVPGTAEDWASLKVSSADTGASFKITKDSGKKLWFEVGGIFISSVADISIYIGLFGKADKEVGVDDTGAENYADGVCFRTLNGTPTEIDTAVGKNGTEGEVKSDGATLAANTEIKLGIYFDGVNTITFFVNGTALADTVAADATNFPHDVGLTPLLYVKEGAGASKSLHVDWAKCVQLR